MFTFFIIWKIVFTQQDLHNCKYHSECFKPYLFYIGIVYIAKVIKSQRQHVSLQL